MPPESFSRCIRCQAGPLVAAPDAWHCPSCGVHYSLRDGIAVLVRDATTHEQRLMEARAQNPTWYVAEQPVADASPWRHHLAKRRRYVESALARELKRRGMARAPRLLDLGCGDGTNLAWLERFTDTIYGSDYNLLRLDRARLRCPKATLFLADLLDYPAQDGAFDVIFFNHVIEHIKDDIAALRAVQRILAPNGLLVLGTPNEGCWWWQMAYRRDPASLASTDHVHFYTADTIAARMRAAGLRVTETHHLGWGPPDWHWDARLRGHKFLDDLFEAVGRVAVPRQASSLYLLATRDA